MSEESKPKRIWLSPPHMGGDEIKFVQEAFDTNWISPAGPHIENFERELTGYCGAQHCVALSSGTAAIHLALVLLKVSAGDEVICSTFTFAATCNPIVYQGATPVFVDSEPDTWNMDPELLREAIEDRIRKKGKRPKAIIIVHLYGMPAKMDELLQVAREFEIPVIEDAAEALGSKYKDRFVGTMGDFGVFSFNGNKIITTSGGGALISTNGEAIEHARYLATQAREKTLHYEHKTVGYNYRISNISAGIGRGQLRILDSHISKRREHFAYYKQTLSPHGFVFPEEPAGYVSNRWLTTMLINNPGLSPLDVNRSLELENIECRPLWKPMHLQPVYLNAPAYTGNVSEALFKTGLCLPSGSSMTPPERERVAKHIIDLSVTKRT